MMRTSPINLRLSYCHPTLATKRRTLAAADISQIEKLLNPVIQEGKLVADHPEIAEMRALREKDIEALDPGVLRIMNPHTYHVSVSKNFGI